MEKREPITIDVQPQELTVERPRQMIRSERPAKPIIGIRPRSPIAQARDLARLGKIVQRPDFWVGLIVENWSKWR
jgi:hypothetical protein